MRATTLLQLLWSTAVATAPPPLPSGLDEILSKFDEIYGRDAGRTTTTTTTTTLTAAPPRATRGTGRGGRRCGGGVKRLRGGGGDDDDDDDVVVDAEGPSSTVHPAIRAIVPDVEERTPPPPTVAIARSRLSDDEPCETVVGLWLSSSLEVMFELRATTTAGRLYVRAVGSDWTGGAESLFGALGPVTAFVSRPDAGDAATFVGHCRVSDRVDTITGIWVIASNEKNKLDHHLAVQPIPDTLHRLNVG